MANGIIPDGCNFALGDLVRWVEPGGKPSDWVGCIVGFWLDAIVHVNVKYADSRGNKSVKWFRLAELVLCDDEGEMICDDSE